MVDFRLGLVPHPPTLDIEFLVSNIYIIIVCCNLENICLKKYLDSLFRKTIEELVCIYWNLVLYKKVNVIFTVKIN